MLKKITSATLALIMIFAMSVSSYADGSMYFEKDNIKIKKIETIEAINQGNPNNMGIELFGKSYPNKHESDWLSDKIGYYDYKVKIDFSLDSKGNFEKCHAYILKNMNFLAYMSNHYTVLCEIENAVYTLKKDKITVKFDMVYKYVPDWFGDGWSESVEYVLSLDDI